MRVAASLALLLLLVATGWVEARPATTFRRGVGVHSMLNWARLVPGDPGRYADRPFDGAPYELPDELIDNVKAAGFDFVRLTLDPGPFLQLTGEPRAALDRKLVATVDRFLAHGLAVMVNLHPNSHVPAYDPVNWLTSTDNATFQAYVALVGRTAHLLERLGTPAVAIEPMNEPPYGYDPTSVARWQKMAETMHAAVRRVAPRLLVVLSGARGGNRLGLEDFDPRPFQGSRVLYSFHYYEPYIFTHEGVVTSQENARLWRYFSAMPYPAGGAPAARVFDTIAANIDADTSLDGDEKRKTMRAARNQVRTYIASGFGRQSIAEAFDGVLAWAKRYDVKPEQIFLGEFGVTRTYGGYRASDPGAMAAWLRDVRTSAEARGFGWCLWVLTGSGGMSLASEDGATTLDRTTLRALGLKAPASTFMDRR